MTTKPSRPGAHGEGIPDASHAYVADPEGPVDLLDALRASVETTKLQRAIDRGEATTEWFTVRVGVTARDNHMARLASSLWTLPTKLYRWTIANPEDEDA